MAEPTDTNTSAFADEQPLPRPDELQDGHAPELSPKSSGPVLVSVADAIELLQAEWANPTPATPTGLAPLDGLLRGGLRAGDFVAVVGPAGGGKSALVAQVALDAAKAGAVVVYASVEMPAPEIVARWLAREAFDALPIDATLRGDLGYASILYGEHTRDADSDVLPLLEGARQRLDAVAGRVFVQQVNPGSTVADLQQLVVAARDRTKEAHPRAPVVLVVDPLQRFFAGASGSRQGRALEALNASETERVGAVAQELKQLCDRDHVAVLATSDTTKAAAGGAVSSALSLRGSYQFNHLATLVLGLHAKDSAAELSAWLAKGAKNDDAGDVPQFDETSLQAALPARWSARVAPGLGRRVVAVECSKNRRGAPKHFALGAVLGAAWFGSSEGGTLDRLPATPAKPKVRGVRGDR
jgi:archaellum biogenesis ATPase FlaH